MKLPSNAEYKAAEADSCSIVCDSKAKVLSNGAEYQITNGNGIKHDKHSLDVEGTDKRNSKCETNGLNSNGSANGICASDSEQSFAETSEQICGLVSNRNSLVNEDKVLSNADNETVTPECRSDDENKQTGEQNTNSQKRAAGQSKALQSNSVLDTLGSACNGEVSSKTPHKLSLKEIKIFKKNLN